MHESCLNFVLCGFFFSILMWPRDIAIIRSHNGQPRNRFRNPNGVKTRQEAGAGVRDSRQVDRCAFWTWSDRDVNVMLRVHVQTHARTPVLQVVRVVLWVSVQWGRFLLANFDVAAASTALYASRRFSLLERAHLCSAGYTGALPSFVFAFVFVFAFSMPSCSLPTSTCSFVFSFPDQSIENVFCSKFLPFPPTTSSPSNSFIIISRHYHSVPTFSNLPLLHF